MEKNEILKSIADNTAELRNAQESLAKKYDVLETEKIARLDNDYASVQKTLAEIKAAVGRGSEVASDKAELKALGRKLIAKGPEALTEAERKTLAITGTSDGSVTVPEIIADQIFVELQKQSVIRQLATVMSTSSDNLIVPVQSGFAAGGFVGETASRTETGTPGLEQAEIKLFEMYALPKATLAVLEDSKFDLEGFLQADVAGTFSVLEGNAFINGAGTSSPKGILTSATTGAAAWNNVHIVETAANTGVATNDILNLVYDLAVPYRQNAAFVGSDSFMLAARKLVNDQGDYLWQDQLSLDVPPTLLGKPVHVDENLEAVGAGNSVAIFGDFKRGYGIADRSGLTIVRDIYTAPGFVKWYVRTRVGGTVLQGRALRVLNVKA